MKLKAVFENNKAYFKKCIKLRGDEPLFDYLIKEYGNVEVPDNGLYQTLRVIFQDMFKLDLDENQFTEVVKLPKKELYTGGISGRFYSPVTWIEFGKGIDEGVDEN